MFTKHETFRLAYLNLTGGCNLPQVGVVGEGDVVGGVPVQAVAVHVEGHRVQHVVDRSHHLQTINKSRRQLQAASDNNGRQMIFFQTLPSQTLRIKED